MFILISIGVVGLLCDELQIKMYRVNIFRLYVYYRIIVRCA